MNRTLFLGCHIPARVTQYQEAAQAVCRKLEISLTLTDAFECCGYPMRNIDEFAFVLSSARNLALAEKEGNDLMVLCKCCFGSLTLARHRLNDNAVLKDRVNQILNQEGLIYTGEINIRHFFSVLHEEIGVGKLKSHIQTKFKNLNIAASVGCHALRPAKVTNFDVAAAPAVFDDLVRVTGATPIDWSKKTECCGAPLLGINDELSQNIMADKLSNAIENKAHFIAVGCPWSFLQFDRVQLEAAGKAKMAHILAPVLYPQLLGLAMGIDASRLGLSRHMTDIKSLLSYLTQEEPHA